MGCSEPIVAAGEVRANARWQRIECGHDDGSSIGFDADSLDLRCRANGAASAVLASGRAGLNMDTQRWERIGDIFERLLGVPLTQRPTLLDSLCGDDAELKKIVVSMLESEDSVQRLEPAGAEVRAPTDSNLQAQDLIDVAFIGTRVGPWRIERKLGAGGMGVVWLAQRADGQFEQRAALKLIKRGMDSEAVLARFFRERQILARLSHPNIARLLDGGLSTDQRPYFVMEYVEGAPIMEYCAAHSLGLRARLECALQICAALQFAHRQLIVHLDIKPSNVIVTQGGEVKLLDFGIAKLLGVGSPDTALQTRSQVLRPLTPGYASPEQLRGEPVSTATDVYGIGCLLYELLTGSQAGGFESPAGDDLLAPSKAAARMPALAGISPRRLQGDLDTIV